MRRWGDLIRVGFLQKGECTLSFAIVIGIAKGFIIYCQNISSNDRAAASFQSSRLAMGYSFSLGLSFLIGASILKTTIAPTWQY